MPRTLFALLTLMLVFVYPAFAEEPQEPAEAAIPELATDEEVDAALEIFKEAYKARGTKGDEKLATQDMAIRELAKTQHPKIVDELTKLSKNRSVDISTSAVLQMGQQRRIPGYAGEAILAAMKRQSKDPTYLMAGLAAIGELGYLGAKDTLIELMGHHDYAVKKNALVTIAELKDHRFIEEIVRLMKALKLEKGASWDGVEVNYDTGTAGDHDQKMAEKIGKEKQAANASKGKRAARSQRDIGPLVLEVMFDLTGEKFSGGIEAREWLEKNKADVDVLVDTCEKVAAAQVAEAKESKKLR
ncbi:MAG: hypothetical protein O2894_05255 [Planctomycetota bacterium]|nr:hypothetical protein [Planctomycetota bacterium]